MNIVKRKIIELGNQCMVMSLPKKWVDTYNLQKGHELDVIIQDRQLLVRTNPELARKTVQLSIEDNYTTTVRAKLINLYRQGVDRIELNYSGEKEQIQQITQDDLFGFEVFEEKKIFILEEISQPDAKNFERILQTNLYKIKQLFESITKKNIQEEVAHIQKYDNFLKRCLSKQLIQNSQNSMFWQFLSDMTHVAKELLHLQEQQQTFNKEEQALLTQVQKIFTAFMQAYQKKSVVALGKLHLFDKELRKEYTKHLQLGLVGYYCIHIARIIHYATSPLIGYFQSES